MNDIIMHDRGEVAAAFRRAIREAGYIAGDDEALDILDRLELAAYLPAGAGDVARQAALNAYNAMAEAAKAEYNPDGGENGDTIRSDSCGDLVVNLAGGFLADPDANADDVIADSWRALRLPGFPSRREWLEAYEGSPVDAPRVYAEERRASVVAEVKDWF